MDNEDVDEKHQLFPGLPDDKRVGVLRTFHHKMYEEETTGNNACQKFYDYYLVKNKCYCLLVLISLALVFIGILSMLYGFMLPPLYRALEGHENKASKIQDSIRAEKQKEIFLIAAIGFISFGLVSAAFGIFMPLYRDSGRFYEEDSIVKTPILVDYELTPNYSSSAFYKGINEGFDDSSDWTPSPSSSPVDNVTFKTFYIQQEGNSRNNIESE